MTLGAERPPSQRGPQFEILDGIEELLALARREGRRGDWPDELPAEAGFAFLPTSSTDFAFPTAGFHQVYLHTQTGPAHAARDGQRWVPYLDLSLMVDGGYLVWQRRLYCGRPPGVALIG